MNGLLNGMRAGLPLVPTTATLGVLRQLVLLLAPPHFFHLRQPPRPALHQAPPVLEQAQHQALQAQRLLEGVRASQLGALR